MLAPDLIEYGIRDEQSDIRAHVTIKGQQVVVFRTEDIRSLVTENSYRKLPAGQPNVEGTTGYGYVVPIEDIDPKFILVSTAFPWENFDVETMSLVEKGDAAVVVVRAAIIANRFPLWVSPIVTSEKELDISGTDILVSLTRRIQVKHDGKAYPKENGGTGNVFIQTHECNPMKLYGSETL